MANPAIHNFTVREGQGFKTTLTLTETSSGDAFDFTDYSASMQVRDHINSSSAVLDFTSGDEITLGGTSGTLIVTATDGVIEAACDFNKKYVQDIVITSPSGTSSTLIQGTFTLIRSVTR